MKLRRSRTKDGKMDRWWFRGYVDVRTGPGQRRRVEKPYHIGYCSEMGQREARAKMASMVADLNRTQEIVQSQVKFSEVLDAWLKSADVVVTTKEVYESRAETHLRTKWGAVRLCDIRVKSVEEWVRDLAGEYRETTVTHIRRVFTQVWNTALRLEYTTQANPMALIKRPRHYAKAPRAKTLPTIEQFHKYLGELKPMFRDIVIVLVGTGVRISECLALKWSEIGEVIRVVASRDKYGNLNPGGKNKNSRRTLPPIPPGYLQLSRPAGAQDSDFVFPVLYHIVIYELKRAAEEIGIDYEGFGAHTFRRMHNTWFRRESNQDTDLAQSQLGHADKTTNDRYYVEDESDLAARAKVVEALMGKVMGGIQ